jgi:hypothetical protein
MVYVFKEEVNVMDRNKTLQLYPIGALGQIGLACLRLQRHHHCAGNCFGRKKPDVTKNNNDQET